MYVYTGEGGGKTTNALGLALRCIGHKKKVIVIQFMKWWKNIGELKFAKLKAVRPYFSIYQFGRPGWLKLKNGKQNIVKINGISLKVRSIEELDRARCKEAINFTKQIVAREKPHLLVLDEIILANYFKLLSLDEIKDLLAYIARVHKSCNVVLTGRYASKELIELSDYANEIKILKMPKKISSVVGIQY